ncbi:MAG: sensor histidine kinase [Alphaproteobacteria bacterium]|nr:sensor histidine kinase [Alphaproteobacteria bacterium]
MTSNKSKTTPVSDTAGATAEPLGVRIARMWRSFSTRLMLLIAIFVAVPIAVYLQLRAADAQKAELLLDATREQGRVVAESLRPLLDQFSAATARNLGETLTRLVGPQIKIKVLLRPEGGSGPDSYFYVAAAPAVPVEYLKQERDRLIDSGVLAELRESCDTVLPSTARYTNPSGQDELLVSMTPLRSEAGCWVVMTSLSTSDLVGASLADPYWKAPEVRAALGIYILLAVSVMWLFFDGWRALRGFAARARTIRGGQRGSGSFAAETAVPELVSVAREFDALVARLHETADAIRFAAEENAHAFKTPIAVIAHSLEPLKRAVTNDLRAARSAERIEQATTRLLALVQAARRMDEAAAEMIDADAAPMDLADLVRGSCTAYAASLADNGLRVEFSTPESVRVNANPDALETVIENLVENAATFSPPGGCIRVALTARDGMAELMVLDDGPGVPESDLHHIFERYMSSRPASDATPGEAHFGIGLWIVHRNVTAFGGEVTARNREQGGLSVLIRFPTI